MTEKVDDANRVTEWGNTRPEIQTAKDFGRVSDAMRFSDLSIQLRRSPDQQKALDKFLDDVHKPASPEFGHWLTAPEFGARFGLAPADLAAVKTWLGSRGFVVKAVNANLTVIVSGTAGQIREAFGTEIHNVVVGGVRHIANMSDPKVPAALASVMAGPVSLHDFPPQKMSAHKRKYTIGGGFELLVPLDIQTIYNLTPAYAAGYSGQGQTIAVVEDTDLFTNGDFFAFRKQLGLSRQYPQATLTVSHPTGSQSCADPGVNADDGEAAIDVEWASAAAPNAAIVMVSCRNASGQTATFGGFAGMSNIFNAATSPATLAALPKVWSVSYGTSETKNGAANNLAITNLYALGAAEGVSIFVSSGDEGAASSDANAASASHGIGVSGWASTPNNVSVGGTDFADTFLGTVANYWTSSNGPAFNSAKSYIPEIPWNDSCASQLLYIANGFSSAVGTAGYCNSAAATTNQEITTASGSGGPSGCATGTASTRSVVSGTCAGYAKPSWQAGLFGNPADGVRDIPDVSLFAANGVWGHYYVTCYSDTNTSRTEGDAGPCNNDPSSWAGFGGTSVSSPIMAGIQALVNQRTGEAQGNPNPVYYQIAKGEYGTGGTPASTLSACNSEAAGGPAPTCVFYDLTLGDMDVNCTALSGTFHNCFNTGGTEGVLSVSNTVLQPAYGTTTGYDYASGIGSVNAYNLIMNATWPTTTHAAQLRIQEATR